MSRLVEEMMAAYPVSGEINMSVNDPAAVLKRIEKYYSAGHVDRIDGLSIAFDSFRFNIRASNTEPLLRLNVESRGDREVVRKATTQLLALINAAD